MSSAEDITSSTVSSPEGSSNSAPEEFPVEAHQPEKDKADPAAPPSEQQGQVELNVGTSLEQSPAEPDEDAGTPLKTKPLPRVNAVAHEVRVKATGARAGNVSGERELFTEFTTSVLVFEKGGVIRLTAAVTPGQLLFLTNEDSKREVVAQVIRKRTHRPTECYVELEFTEPAPGFWGMEFSAATALLPKDERLVAAVEMVASSETTADELEEAAPPPTVEEVQALRKEIDALRSQLSLQQPQAEPGQPAPPPADVISDTSATPSHAVTQPAQVPSRAYEPTAGSDFTPLSSPMDASHGPDGMTDSEQELLPKPALDFHISLPKRKRSFRARGQFTPGFRTGMLRLAVLSGILATLIGVAWYKHWFPWMKEEEAKKISVESLAGTVTAATPVAEAAHAKPISASAPAGQIKSSNDMPAAHGSGPNTELLKGTQEATAPTAHIIDSSSSVRSTVPAPKGKATPPDSIAKHSSPPSLPVKGLDSPAASARDGVLVPPKLIKAELAVASLDDLRDFETGSVIVDAIVDASGAVQTINTVSGPPSLRRPAMLALKSYKYEPATLNGKPVPAHVTVKIRFRFEP